MRFFLQCYLISNLATCIAMAVDFIVDHHREDKNVSRKFSSGVNLQRERTAGIATGTV